MLYRITHTTHYHYDAPALQCLNEVRLTPRELPYQHIRDTSLVVSPTPAFLNHREDYFGNDTATFAVFSTHAELTATATSIVEVNAESPNLASTLSWEDARNQVSLQADDESLDASEFVFSSPFVPIRNEFQDYARPTFTPGRPLTDALQELSHRIHEDFEYEPESTSIDMPLIDILKERHGVCQDFAHIMLATLRSLRLPARYVSGYLKPGPKIQGAQASHAWVAAFVPGVGWISFDPTNDLIPSDGHITLAWGRDYGDVTPVKGVTLGGGGQKVAVAVYVQTIPST